MRLRCGDELFDVQLRETKGEWEAVVDGQPLRLSLRSTGERALPRPARGRSHDAPLRPRRRGRSTSSGTASPTAWSRRAKPRALRRATTRAPSRRRCPGRVSAVKVAVGQRVAKGEELLVVEAMKMENALRAPKDGVVRALHASVGEMVAPGRTLVEIGEPGGPE